MKNKIKIILGVCLLSGLVFAASITKFYGDIDMQSHKITNLATPTSNNDATSKTYVDTQIHTRLNKQGGQLTGTLDMLTNYIIRVKKPRSGVNGKLDATPRDYVDGATNAVVNYASSTFLPLGGGIMSGDLDMGYHYITNVHAPRSGALGYYDVVNKIYTKSNFLPLDGTGAIDTNLHAQAMSGRINMGNNKITNLATPTASADATTKAYVDGVLNESMYQYFALRKGSGYTPIYNLDVSTNRYFDVVVLKAFSGAITSYFEDGAASCSYSTANQTWKAGDKIKIPFHAYNTLSATNGTLVVKSEQAVFGSFGITFKRTSSPSFRAYIGIRNYAPNTSAMINEAINSQGEFAVGITNITSVSATDVQVAIFKASYYISDTTYTTEAVYNGSPTFAPTVLNIPSIPAKGCAWLKIVMTSYDDTTLGMKWSFELNSDGSASNFGQFFVPPASE